MLTKTYIVRVYRYDKKAPQNLVGFVEDVENDDKKKFTCFDELKTALEQSCATGSKQRQDAPRQ